MVTGKWYLENIITRIRKAFLKIILKIESINKYLQTVLWKQKYRLFLYLDKSQVDIAWFGEKESDILITQFIIFPQWKNITATNWTLFRIQARFISLFHSQFPLYGATSHGKHEH